MYLVVSCPGGGSRGLTPTPMGTVCIGGTGGIAPGTYTGPWEEGALEVVKLGVKDFAFGFNLDSLAFEFKDDFLVKSAPVETPEEDDGDDGAVVDVAEFRGEIGVSVCIDEGCTPLVVGSSTGESPEIKSTSLAVTLIDSMALPDGVN